VLVDCVVEDVEALAELVVDDSVELVVELVVVVVIV
jgi:hypothetical protein